MRTIIQVLFLSLSLSLASVVYAKPANNGLGMIASSKSEAMQIARQHFGGKVLKVQLEKGKSHASYKVKLLTNDGTVRVVTITAKP